MTLDWLARVEPFAAPLIAVSTVALLGVTAWYAKKTRDIALENHKLVAATENMAAATGRLAESTEKMASATETLSSLASDELYGPPPILTCYSGESDLASLELGEVRVRWKNVGRGAASELEFGYQLDTPAGPRVFWSVKETVRDLSEGQIVVTHSLEGPFVQLLQTDETSIVYLARYKDAFGKAYLSESRKGNPIQVHRLTGEGIPPVDV